METDGFVMELTMLRKKRGSGGHVDGQIWAKLVLRSSPEAAQDPDSLAGWRSLADSYKTEVEEKSELLAEETKLSVAINYAQSLSKCCAHLEFVIRISIY